jgi:hypothetical protein
MPSFPFIYFPAFESLPRLFSPTQHHPNNTYPQQVVEKNFYWPTSPWPKGKYFKACALYWQEDLLSGLEAISLRVMGNLGWTKEEVEALLIDVRRDIKDTAIKAYFPINVVYGRKPLEGEAGT